MAVIRTNGVYDKMTFPPYEFIEYPKWVTRPNGKQIIVHSLAEQLRVAGESTEGAEPELSGADAERNSLLALVQKQHDEMEIMRKQLAAATAAVDLPKLGDKPPVEVEIHNAPTPNVAAQPAKPLQATPGKKV